VACPTVEIRQGTSTYSISQPGADPSVLTLRYQATFAQTARECKLAGTTVRVRLGIEGRVILGPAGGPGPSEGPVRFARVQEGPEPKTIATKLQWISIPIPADQPNVPFTHIEEDLTFPMPRQAAELEAYVIYVGFDRGAVKEPERKVPAKKPPPKSRRPG